MKTMSSRISLPGLSASPSRKDIEQLFMSAKAQTNVEVELIWSRLSGAGEFHLVVKCPKMLTEGPMTRTLWQGEPVWELFENDGEHLKHVWRYETSELDFILDVVNVVQNIKHVKTPAVKVGKPATGGRKAVGAKPGSFEGDFSWCPLPILLQQIEQKRLTGSLEILGSGGQGTVSFADGQPVDARVKEIRGDGALLEMFLWLSGTYSFQPGKISEERTLKNPVEMTTMEGMTLVDQKKRLENAGLSMTAVLAKVDGIANESHLQLMLSKAVSIPWEKQRDVFYRISDEISLADILRDYPMAEHEWIPIFYNFASCGVIEILPSGTSQSPLLFLGEKKLDVDQVYRQLLDAEGQMCKYETLLLELQKEYYRYKHYNWPLSIIIFQLRYVEKNSTETSVLPASSITTAVSRINMVKRHLDLLAHFEEHDYALLLPNTSGPSAAFVANRVYQAIVGAPLAPKIDRQTLSTAFGISSLQPDFSSVEQLLMVAKLSMNQAQGKTYPIVLARPSRST
jgi:hypothetical protein